jgi:hypothetical protein
MILKGNKLFVMKKWVDLTQQKAVTFANPARNAASTPVARKSVLELSDGSASTLARFLPPHLRLIALADIPSWIAEPDRRRNEQGFASETSQLLAAPLSASFLPDNPLRRAA